MGYVKSLSLQDRLTRFAGRVRSAVRCPPRPVSHPAHSAGHELLLLTLPVRGPDPVPDCPIEASSHHRTFPGNLSPHASPAQLTTPN
ncbi:hypothetical protein BDW22DRAFT_1243101 [Trametopsis cervina]|nr:hypothetical protein BDW22DRAFT_1243101 [Trametopsis cervina]